MLLYKDRLKTFARGLYFSANFWHAKIEPKSINGLNKASAIDTLQLRGVDLQRFIRKLGSVSEITILEIVAAIATVIEFGLF